MNEERVFIGLGSNMGDKGSNIKKALDMLEDSEKNHVIAVAPLYKTAPIGYVDQDMFLNTVAEIRTGLEPEELLAEMLSVENHLGRERSIRWGPRVVDLDLLMYGDRIIKLPELELPHPRMTERAFVMVPLADLAPGLIVNDENKTVMEMAESLITEQYIEKVK